MFCKKNISKYIYVIAIQLIKFYKQLICRKIQLVIFEENQYNFEVL